MLNTSLAPWPDFTPQEAEAVSRVVSSGRVNYWTGDECRSFEREFAAWVGSDRAIALANGTLALDLALKGLGIGPGDEVVVTPRTFIASVSCVVNAGATPVFADVDRDSGNIEADTIEKVLTDKTRAVIPVHLGGFPCDMGRIMDLSRARDLFVIEDCAQAHGARWQGRSVGSIGHVGAWSFCQDKIMTTGGEGGMVTCNDAGMWSEMWAFKDHGKDWGAVYERDHPPGFRWVHESFGTNWRLTEMQSAIGRVQLARMRNWTEARTRHAQMIMDALAPFAGARGPIRVPKIDPADGSRKHAYYKLYAYVRPENLPPGYDRDSVLASLNAAGAFSLQGSCSEVYLEQAFANTNLRPPTRLPVAKELGETSIMFLVHPTLTPQDMARTCEAISEVFCALGK